MKKIGLFLIIICIIFSVTACKSTTKSKDESPDAAVSHLITAIKNVDTPTITKYLGTDKVFDSTTDSLGAADDKTNLILSKLSCNIITSSINENTATVETEITSLDMKEIFSTYMSQALAISMSNAFKDESERLSESEVQKQTDDIFNNLMKDEKAKLTTQQITIQLTKNGDSWKITNDETFQDAISGGLISSINDYKSSIGSTLTTAEN